MNDEYADESDQAMDQAVAARLARLRTMPVDTTNLDKAIRAQIGSSRRNRRIFAFRPLRALAASVLLISVIAALIMLSSSSGPALAEAAQMAQVHQDIISGRIPVMQVSSIEQANRMLDSQSPGAPTLPAMPDSHIMACCMKSVHNKKMACVLLKDEAVPITLSVASASDMKVAPAPIVTRNGIDYRVQKVGDLNMVMTERDGKWLCLIGQTPADHLIDVASQIRF
jgi:hypothetical protein